MTYDSVPPGYDVEFTDCNGVTLALLTLRDDDLEAAPTGPEERCTLPLGHEPPERLVAQGVPVTTAA